MIGTTASPLVVFRLAGHDYALPVSDVVEVLRMVAFEPMPDTPSWLLGIVNLRGRPVPILDLAGRLGLREPVSDLDSRIIIVRTEEGLVGGVADEVFESLGVPDDLGPPQGLENGSGHPLKAVARLEGNLVLVLDPGVVWGTTELPLERRPDADD